MSWMYTYDAQLNRINNWKIKTKNIRQLLHWRFSIHDIRNTIYEIRTTNSFATYSIPRTSAIEYKASSFPISHFAACSAPLTKVSLLLTVWLSVTVSASVPKITKWTPVISPAQTQKRRCYLSEYETSYCVFFWLLKKLLYSPIWDPALREPSASFSVSSASRAR